MQHPGTSRGLWTSVLVLQALGLPACSSTGSAEAISEAQVQQAVVTPLDDQVMRVVGRQLLDSNGVPFLTRGIEGWFGSNAQAHISTLVDGIASQGFNAVRLQLLTTNLGKIESLIKRIHAKNMVVYLVSSNMPIAEGVEWFGLAETQAMIAKNRRNMVIDATIEEWGDCESDTDTATWLNDQKVTITKFRNWGYTQSLTIGTQMYWGAYTSGFSYRA